MTNQESNPVLQDAEAMAILQLLSDKGLTPEDVKAALTRLEEKREVEMHPVAWWLPKGWV